MPFTKGNKLWNSPNAIATRFKKGEHRNPTTEFKKGHLPWHTGKGKGFNAQTRYAWKVIESRQMICEICGNSDLDYLTAHHKDKDRNNNSNENIQILCKSCHSRLHGKLGNKGQFKKGMIPWNKRKHYITE